MNYLKLFGVAAFAIGAILYLASADEQTITVGKQNYDIGDYTKISVNSAVDVTVKVGHDYDMKITGDEKDLKRLKIYVKGQTLVIKNKNQFFNTRSGNVPKISITLPLLKKFTVNGSSDARLEDVQGSSFKLVVNGSGKVEFAGRSDEFRAEVNGSGSLISDSFEMKEGDIEINGSGTVDMSGACVSLEIDIAGSGDFSGRYLKCETADIDIAGSGDVTAYVSDRVEVEVQGSGDINIYGKPKHVKDSSRKKDHITLR